jgi:hypothetical protein
MDMSGPKVLLVYYSRGGNTRRVAQEIARQLPCAIEEIGSLDERRGWVGYLRSAIEARIGRAAAIRAPRHDPADFDLVVVGTPVWYLSLSSPVRAYLATNAPGVRSVAFVVTYGGIGARRVLEQLRDVAEKPPLATLALRERDLDDLEARVAPFVSEIRARLGKAPAAAA